MLDRKFVFGLTFIAAVALVIVGTVAMYRGTFKSTVPMTVVSGRAGLTLAQGSPVKLYGVQVGTVRRASVRGSKVDVELAIDSGQISKIPSNVTAQIVPPTAFGAKYVQLSVTGTPSRVAMAAGAVIGSDRVTTEINTAFENLSQVLSAARPDEVNNALTALATAVNNRGERIGGLISQIDAYLESFDPSLRTLSQDLRSSKSVVDVYDRALPSLLASGNSLSTTSDTLVRQQASLHAFLINLNSFSNQTDGLLRTSQAQLRTTMGLLDPVTNVVAKYSPELPCVVLGLASVNKLAEHAVGGINPGITTITRIVPGRAPYLAPRNLPVIGDTQGPGCYGLPYVTPQEAQRPAPFFDTGANPYVGPQPTPGDKLSTTLFGLLAGVVNLP